MAISIYRLVIVDSAFFLINNAVGGREGAKTAATFVTS